MERELAKPMRLTKAELLKRRPIYHDVVLHKTVYESESSFVQMYTHELIEISMVTSGGGVHRILNQEIPCKEGDIYIVTPDIPHGYFVNAAGECMTVRRFLFDIRDWFEGEVLIPGHPRYCYGVFRDNAVTAYAMLNAQTQEKLQGLFDAIVREMLHQKQEWRDGVRANLTLLMITLGRYVNGAIKNIPSSPPKDWGLVSYTIRTVTEQFGKTDLTLETIADSLYVSKSHLSRVFKRLTGESFSDYLRKIRMTHACNLLRETDLRVEEIVRECGQKDIPYFYRAFHCYMGMTPHQYRTLQASTLEAKDQKERNRLLLDSISENLRKGRAVMVKELIGQALEGECAPEAILNDGMLRGMSIIGEQFKNNEVFVPEVLVAARAMNAGMQMLKPYLSADGILATGRVCIGTVQGDLHDIGKNLVRMMMEGKGLEVIDLGVDVPPEVFVRTAIEQDCQVICCSALLTTTMSVLADVVEEAKRAGIRDKVKIMIGGAPVSEAFCRRIGADCYTVDAASAAEAAVELCCS
ncbi:MAG: helix-turn-helix domain-containing protein [Ruminococcaceae bacterium]|nr:helix-turn-helix domain-containing protein [Oscillospiraceae bacterium]